MTLSFLKCHELLGGFLMSWALRSCVNWFVSITTCFERTALGIWFQWPVKSTTQLWKSMPTLSSKVAEAEVNTRSSLFKSTSVRVGNEILLARLTRRSAARLGLLAGKEVWIQIKAVALL